VRGFDGWTMTDYAENSKFYPKFAINEGFSSRQKVRVVNKSKHFLCHESGSGLPLPIIFHEKRVFRKFGKVEGDNFQCLFGGSGC